MADKMVNCKDMNGWEGECERMDHAEMNILRNMLQVFFFCSMKG